jgi:hypothetical protein
MRAFAIVALAGVIGMDPASVQDALAIANSSIESAHRRFHADYQFPVSRAPVDRVSVVTPFRRVVLTAETAARTGGRRFGQQDALAALQPAPDRVEVYVELTFHPHHTWVTVPEFMVALEPLSRGGPPVAPIEIDRLPRFGTRMDNPWFPYSYPFQQGPRLPGAESMAGATIIGRFTLGQLDARGAYAVVVADDKQELARVKVDLGRLR